MCVKYSNKIAKYEFKYFFLLNNSVVLIIFWIAVNKSN